LRSFFKELTGAWRCLLPHEECPADAAAWLVNGLPAQEEENAGEFICPPSFFGRCFETYFPPGHTMKIRKKFVVPGDEGSIRVQVIQRAVRSDGSRTEHHGAWSKIYNVPENTFTLVDHTKRTFRRFAGSDGRPQWVHDDDQCSYAANRYWFRNWRSTGEVCRRGNRLVKWTGIDGGGSDNEAHFAPEQHCLELYRVTEYATRHEVYEMEVTSLTWGERSEDLFQVPEGYARDKHP
jgi:hypothetical protein